MSLGHDNRRTIIVIRSGIKILPELASLVVGGIVVWRPWVTILVIVWRVRVGQALQHASDAPPRIRAIIWRLKEKLGMGVAMRTDTALPRGNLDLLAQNSPNVHSLCRVERFLESRQLLYGVSNLLWCHALSIAHKEECA